MLSANGDRPCVRLTLRGPGVEQTLALLAKPEVIALVRETLLGALEAEPLREPEPPAEVPAASAPEEEDRAPTAVVQLAARVGASRGLTALQRVTRAWELGVSDRRIASAYEAGRTPRQRPTPIPKFPNAWFVGLRGTSAAPFWTSSSAICQLQIRGPSPGNSSVHEGAVFRGLPSKTEAKAYLIGAECEFAVLLQ